MVVASQQGIDSLESRDPATGEVIGTVPVLGPDEVNAAVDRARQAARTWGQLGFDERREYLVAWRREMASRVDELATLISRENGKPRLDALQEVFLALSHLDWAAKHAAKVLGPRTVSSGLLANFRSRVSYEPLGVVGVIGPWNYPIFTPMGSIGYALAAGNAVVFKPSELTPLVGVFMAETAATAIPIANLLQTVTGDGRTGGALAHARVDKIAFTGSTGTGKKVMAAAAENLTPVCMELGGNDAMIVAADADIDRAAEAAVFGALTNAGQACISVERAYVVDSVYDRFVDKVSQHARQLRTSDDDDAHLGAMTRADQIDLVRGHLDDAIQKGATAIVGGLDAIRPPFIEPTVLVDLTPDMKIMQEETFGPVLPIIRVRDIDEAVSQANNTPFGLGSSIFGRKGVRELADKLVAGMTSVNSVMAFSSIPSLPFGGVGESGFGRIHGDDGLREFARPKATAEQRFALPVNPMSFEQPTNAYDQMKGMIKQVFGGGVVDRAVDAIQRRLR